MSLSMLSLISGRPGGGAFFLWTKRDKKRRHVVEGNPAKRVTGARNGAAGVERGSGLRQGRKQKQHNSDLYRRSRSCLLQLDADAVFVDNCQSTL